MSYPFLSILFACCIADFASATAIVRQDAGYASITAHGELERPHQDEKLRRVRREPEEVEEEEEDKSDPVCSLTQDTSACDTEINRTHCEQSYMNDVDTRRRPCEWYQGSCRGKEPCAGDDCWHSCR
mmetsp:Transcript_14954/g.26191  ORF Transcript_14954/g.26191 Transcript_14954/m.26191 type:complete len:127 (+) Transcript_14954:44-424(+)